MRIALVIGLIFFSLPLQAQDILKGRVIDENGQGIPAVNITIQGTAIGTARGAIGQFEIVIPNTIQGPITLYFQHLQFEAYQETVDWPTQQSVPLVVLSGSINTIDEFGAEGFLECFLNSLVARFFLFTVHTGKAECACSLHEGGANITGHDNDGVAEVDNAPLPVG